MKLTTFAIFIASSAWALATPHADAIKQALAEFQGLSPRDAASAKFRNKDYQFIFVGGFSVSAPGNFQIGSDLIFKKFKNTFLPTDDTPSPEEVEIFRTAYIFAKEFNEAMMSHLMSADLIEILEVEFKVIEDAHLFIAYSSGDTLLLREQKGKRRILWIEAESDLEVKSGKIKIIRSEKKRPNKAMQPTPVDVTDRADARSAPSTSVADL